MKAIGAFLVLAAFLAFASAAQDADSPSPSLLEATVSRLPVYFIENRGVYPDPVAYYVQGLDKTLFFTRSGITFRLKGKDRGWVVKLEFVGADPDVAPRGEDRQPAVFSYFKGPEKDWKTGLRTFSKVVYEDLWPGIDLVYHGSVNRLKYDFLVKPGADPGQIRLRYRGAAGFEVMETGGLRVGTPAGDFEDEPPVAWQEIGGERVAVETTFRLADRSDEGGHAFGFRVGGYDPSLPLILDPAVLIYCGYVGGFHEDSGNGIAVDTVGNAYVTGHTSSDQTTFPVRVGPDLSYNGGATGRQEDVFVTKVDASGKGLVYCGYIGGTGDEAGHGIAVDARGNAYVTGWTTSNERTFPVTVGPDRTYNGTLQDAFVAKVNAQGTALVYCGYIGGGQWDTGSGIAVDAGGNAHVTGRTTSNETTFPVRIGPDLTHNGADDAFVAKVNARGTALVHCGYIGGSDSEWGYGIAVDANGNEYVTGITGSREATFPVTVGPDLTYNDGASSGGIDTFVAKVNASGKGLDYCGYIGGDLADHGLGIAVDAGGNAYVTGWTKSDEKTFPVKVGPGLIHNREASDAFVAKVNARGSGLVYCGYIGGSQDETGIGIAVDGGGNAYVTGWTQSDAKTFPVKVGPDLTHNGGHDAFMAKVDARGAAIVYCGYIGGIRSDWGHGIAVDTSGNAYVTGMTSTEEATFPVTVGPDLTFNDGRTGPGGGWDAFVAKVMENSVQVSGTPRPGGTTGLALTATHDAGLAYQVGSSLGAGPIMIGNRALHLRPDNVLVVSTSGFWPGIFSGYRGVMNSQGQAQATIHIPNAPALIGVRLHSAFVTLSPTAPWGIKSISNTVTFSIRK